MADATNEELIGQWKNQPAPLLPLLHAFHDRDVAPEGKSLSASNKNFDAVAKVLKAD